MYYMFNIVLDIGHADLFNIMLQYFNLMWFKIVILYQATNASDIPSLLPTLLWGIKLWLFREGMLWNFTDVSDGLETIFRHLEIKLYPWSNP